jgi:hypothetical protein
MTPPARQIPVALDTPPPVAHDEVAARARYGRQLLEQLEAGGQARSDALSAIRGNVQTLSFDAGGCRAVQQALVLADKHEREALVAELRGHVRTAMRSPHANFVVQKIVEALPPALASFVAEELVGIGSEASRHRFGCRIICRLLEHHCCSGSSNPTTAALLEEVLANAQHLCHHAFAHHVVDSILEHGTADQRHQVVAAVQANLLQNARNRYASYVVEQAMKFCSAADKVAFVEEFASRPDDVLSLAVHEYGGHVLKTLLQLPCQNVSDVKRILRSGTETLQTSKYGRRLLEDL